MLITLLGYEQFGNNWVKLKEMIGTRSGEQIRSHAQKYLNKLKYEDTQKQLGHLSQEERVVFRTFKAKKRVNKYTKKSDK